MVRFLSFIHVGIIMKTTLNLDDSLLTEAMLANGEKTKTAVIRRALLEFIH